MALLCQQIIDEIETPVILKSDGGVVLTCNQAFLRLRNIAANKIIGFTAHDFLPQKEADCHMEADKALLVAKDGIFQYAYEHEDDDQIGLSSDVYKSITYDSKSGARGIFVVVKKRVKQQGPFMAGEYLTPREKSVLQLLVRGHTQKQIAKTLILSHHTVADYCRIIYRKLGVNSRAEAQILAITKMGIS